MPLDTLIAELNDSVQFPKAIFMKVGTLTVQFRLHFPNSLKEKRSIIKHMMAQLQQKFNISVAEVDHQDDKRMATLGISLVGTDNPYVHQVLSKVASQCEHFHDCDVEDSHLEVW